MQRFPTISIRSAYYYIMSMIIIIIITIRHFTKVHSSLAHTISGFFHAFLRLVNILAQFFRPASDRETNRLAVGWMAWHSTPQ